MQLKNVCKTFTAMMILLLAHFLNFMPSLVCATEFEMGDREINPESSLIKWFLARNTRPFTFIPYDPRLILATIAEEGTDDFAYVLEVTRELSKDKAFNNIPVELIVQSTESQKKEIYRAFSEASDLKINWIYKDERQEYLTGSMQMEYASFSLFLSNWSGMRVPKTSNWLGIGRYSNVDAMDKGLDVSLIDDLLLIENYYQSSGVNNPANLTFSPGNKSLLSDSGYYDHNVNHSHLKYSLDSAQDKSCIALPKFGLGELHLGLPFNSELIEKIDDYEMSVDKESTSLHKDLKQLLQDKPWLGYALTGHRDLNTQAETIQNVSYYTAYFRDETFLKEYLDVIRRTEPGEIKIVTPIKSTTLRTPAFREMLKEMGFSNIHYKSRGASGIYFQPTASEYRKITFINPGFIDNESAHNALAYFSQPLTLVTGDISLIKAIAMNKIPFCEWRYFQTDVNKHLQSLWKGSGLELFFVNDYQPEIKAAALNQFKLDSPLRRKINRQIISAHNAMPGLLDVIWLVHRPSHALWNLDTQVKERLEKGENSELFDEIKQTESKDIRDILAAKVLIQHSRDQSTGYNQYQLDELFMLIQDPRLREYLLPLLNKH
ncbi:hypothetical protein [Endozoicomonas sp. 8E]|uniref:hypothetical protein n=1 Tax=Endozoicomonas sp. 8E TaxID=3035692 RepID=UPI0029391523|nr:hypothetical protein [Endozoicomonas sp. 8E]WOG29468.1 hypothetical protein P6910_07410 [Endozoicomonas sp. 8E]